MQETRSPAGCTPEILRSRPSPRGEESRSSPGSESHHRDGVSNCRRIHRSEIAIRSRHQDRRCEGHRAGPRFRRRGAGHHRRPARHSRNGGAWPEAIPSAPPRRSPDSSAGERRSHRPRPRVHSWRQPNRRRSPQCRHRDSASAGRGQLPRCFPPHSRREQCTECAFSRAAILRDRSMSNRRAAPAGTRPTPPENRSCTT